MAAISLHAIERYCDRIDPKASFTQARQAIRLAMDQSTRLKEHTRSGHTYYLAPNMRLVVAEERGSLTIITVLGLDEWNNHEEQIPDLAKELMSQFDNSIELLSIPKKELKEKEKEVRYKSEIVKLQSALSRANSKLSKLKTPETHQIQTLMDQLEKAKRQYERQKQHAERMANERDQYKQLLKVVLVALLKPSKQTVKQALEKVELEYPSLIEFIKKDNN